MEHLPFVARRNAATWDDAQGQQDSNPKPIDILSRLSE